MTPELKAKIIQVIEMHRERTRKFNEELKEAIAAKRSVATMHADLIYIPTWVPEPTAVCVGCGVPLQSKLHFPVDDEKREAVCIDCYLSVKDAMATVAEEEAKET